MLNSCSKLPGPDRTTEERVQEFGEAVKQRLQPYFQHAGVSYPPSQLTLVGFKKDRLLQVYAAGANEQLHFIHTYPILAASGELGPKFREGDLQVPEGIYRIRELNPNSKFHLSLWIDYPNAFDRARATSEHRSRLGGEIMIHGGAVSVGCIALGDQAAEDLFILAALTKPENVSIILTPVDLRHRPAPAIPNQQSNWTKDLYQQIRRELNKLPPVPLN